MADQQEITIWTAMHIGDHNRHTQQRREILHIVKRSIWVEEADDEAGTRSSGERITRCDRVLLVLHNEARMLVISGTEQPDLLTEAAGPEVITEVIVADHIRA